jgi:hypothetical protein
MGGDGVNIAGRMTLTGSIANGHMHRETPTTLISMTRNAGTPRFAMSATWIIFDGHLHHMHGDHIDEHVIAVDAANPVK